VCNALQQPLDLSEALLGANDTLMSVSLLGLVRALAVSYTSVRVEGVCVGVEDRFCNRLVSRSSQLDNAEAMCIDARPIILLAVLQWLDAQSLLQCGPKALVATAASDTQAYGITVWSACWYIRAYAHSIGCDVLRTLAILRWPFLHEC
jgi:hypothetical protein